MKKNLLIWGLQSPTLAVRVLYTTLLSFSYFWLVGFKSQETLGILFLGTLTTGFFVQVLMTDILNTKEAHPYYRQACAVVSLAGFVGAIAIELFAPVSQGWIVAFMATSGAFVGASCARRALGYWERVDRERAASEADANKGKKKNKKNSMRA